VLRLAPLDSHKDWRRGRVQIITRTPGALAVSLLGNRLRSTLALFFANVVNALEAAQQEAARRALDLRQGFSPNVTAADTSDPTIPKEQ
jgi:hypothetical protein